MNKISHKKYLPILLIVVLVVGTYSTASALLGSRSTSAQNARPQSVPAAPISAPSARPQSAGSGCVGLSCHGNAGGYGNHTTGSTGGAGNLSGYSAVRFDVFRPEPSLERCDRFNNQDQRVMSQLGINGNPIEDRFWHRRVAQERSSGDIVGGVQDAVNFGSNIFYNANTGVEQAALPYPLDKAPTQANPWIGPDYLGIRYCLPLSGEGLIRSELENRPPSIKIISDGVERDFTSPGPDVGPLEYLASINKALIGSKKLVLRIEIDESTSTAGIPIRFEHLKEHIKINVGDVYEFFELLEAQKNGTADEESANDIWKFSTDRSTGIYADVRKVTPTESFDGTTRRYVYDIPLTLKKSGIFLINVQVNYQAFVGTATAPYTGLSGVSETLAMNVFSAKAVNRQNARG